MGNSAIGGYFQLELNKNNTFPHPNLIHLNSARNCLEYILENRMYKKIYIPYFTCDVLLEPITKLDIEYDFYDVDNFLEPIFDYEKIQEDEAFLVTNYFGIKTKFIENLSKKSKNLIVDNAQAFYAMPIYGMDTFYSPRKFVGIADGGLLATNLISNKSFDIDVSYHRMSHLLKRIDLSAEDAYSDFIVNDKTLENQEIKLMSNITKAILSNLDYNSILRIRRENYMYLEDNLKLMNLLNIDLDKEDVPMIYPFRVKKSKLLREKLISEKIYCATYWPNVLEWCDFNVNSYHLTEEIIALPIDQRYSIEDMQKIIHYVERLN